MYRLITGVFILGHFACEIKVYFIGQAVNNDDKLLIKCNLKIVCYIIAYLSVLRIRENV